MGPPRPQPSGGGKRPSTLESVQQMERDREQRRQAAAQRRESRVAEEKRNAQLGIVGDVDFVRAIRGFREEHGHESRPHEAVATSESKVRASQLLEPCCGTKSWSRVRYLISSR